MKFINIFRCEKYKNFYDAIRLCLTLKDLKSGGKENLCVRKMKVCKPAIYRSNQRRSRQMLMRKRKISEACKLTKDGRSMCLSLKMRRQCKSSNYKSWLRSAGQRKERKRERVAVARRKRSDRPCTSQLIAKY